MLTLDQRILLGTALLESAKRSANRLHAVDGQPGIHGPLLGLVAAPMPADHENAGLAGPERVDQWSSTARSASLPVSLAARAYRPAAEYVERPLAEPGVSPGERSRVDGPVARPGCFTGARHGPQPRP